MEKKNELMEEKLANLKLSKPLFFRLVNLLKKLTGWFEKLLVAGMRTILCVDVQTTIERGGWRICFRGFLLTNIILK